MRQSTPEIIKYRGQVYKLADVSFKWVPDKSAGSWPKFNCKMPRALLRVYKDAQVFGPNPWKWSLYPKGGGPRSGSPLDGPGLSSQQQAQDAAEAAYRKL